MVLDAKALTWAARHDIDTAKLKKAKVPIYGKWYYPEIPSGVALVNLETGEQEVFADRMLAGEVIYVPAADLVRAGLAPEDFAVRDAPGGLQTVDRGMRVITPEPLLAMARPPGYGAGEQPDGFDPDAATVPDDPATLSGIHMPSASISPFVLGVGFCLVFAGLLTNPIVLIAGLLWMAAGAIGWVRIGVLEYRAAEAHGGHGGHGPETAEGHHSA
jgi:hypothetical protein